MKVTISDVARLAGVSTATVSHTINSTRYVSGETKEKVYRAIAELGYTPDASARSFRTGKKKTIGFIVPDISNKFFATMIESVENYLSAHGYHLIIANTKENPEREETNIRLLSAGLVDGLLIASTMEDFSRFESLIPAGFPVVLVDRTFDTKRFPSVSVSNFQPIYRSVCRLAGKGDKRIGMIGGLPRLMDMGQCNDAYGAIQVAVALAEAFGCSVNELPLSFVLSWYEQKAVCILLTLLHLGIKNIRLGPSLPAFLSPNILNFLVENYGIAPITTPEEDMNALLNQK